MYEQKPQLLVD